MTLGTETQKLMAAAKTTSIRHSMATGVVNRRKKNIVRTRRMTACFSSSSWLTISVIYMMIIRNLIRFNAGLRGHAAQFPLGAMDAHPDRHGRQVFALRDLSL